MGAVTCCQNQVIRQQEFREYCLNAASPDYKGYIAAIQHEEFNSSPELITQNRQFIQGSWKKGETKTGRGVIFSPEQFYYEGQVVQGVAKGEGKIIWPNKFSYKGNIEDNKASGSGELQLGEKNVSLKGLWVRGYPKLNQKMLLNKQGKQGSITFVDQSAQKSQQDFFKETLIVNIEFGKEGLIYQGEVKQKNHIYKIEGKGTMKYPDGSFYTGDFVNGKMHGIGKYYWSKTNNWFEGEYKANVREGRGTYYYNNQEFETGEWKGGILVNGPASNQQESKGVPVP